MIKIVDKIAYKIVNKNFLKKLRCLKKSFSKYLLNSLSLKEAIFW